MLKLKRMKCMDGFILLTCVFVADANRNDDPSTRCTVIGIAQFTLPVVPKHVNKLSIRGAKHLKLF